MGGAEEGALDTAAAAAVAVETASDGMAVWAAASDVVVVGAVAAVAAADRTRGTLCTRKRGSGY